MRDLEDFFHYVQPFAMACPEPTALRYVLEAATEFCERTRIWRETDSFTVNGHEAEVLCVPPFASLHSIERAWFNGQPLEPAAYPDASGEELGCPRYITQVSPNSIVLNPRGEGVLRLSMHLKPAPEAEQVPDFLYDQHARAIGWGALREICLLPNQPFTSPDMAALFSQRFEAACNRHFATNLKGQQRARARTRPSYF